MPMLSAPSGAVQIFYAFFCDFRYLRTMIFTADGRWAHHEYGCKTGNNVAYDKITRFLHFNSQCSAKHFCGESGRLRYVPKVVL